MKREPVVAPSRTLQTNSETVTSKYYAKPKIAVRGRANNHKASRGGGGGAVYLPSPPLAHIYRVSDTIIRVSFIVCVG